MASRAAACIMALAICLLAAASVEAAGAGKYAIEGKWEETFNNRTYDVWCTLSRCARKLA